MKKKAPAAAAKQHYTEEERQAAVAAVFGGSLPLAVTINPVAKELTGHRLAGYMLLKNCLDAMMNNKDYWHVGFCGSMVESRYEAITTKQAKWLNIILKKYLNLELEHFAERETL